MSDLWHAGFLWAEEETQSVGIEQAEKNLFSYFWANFRNFEIGAMDYFQNYKYRIEYHEHDRR